MEINDLIEIYVQFYTSKYNNISPVLTTGKGMESCTTLRKHEAWIPGIIENITKSKIIVKYQCPIKLINEIVVISKKSQIPIRRVKRKPVITIDFDGTIVKHKYPNIGDPVPGALETLRELQEQNVRCILLTMREGEDLKQAVEFCASHDIIFWSVNSNPGQLSWAPEARKIYSNVHIDDTNCGSPLIYPANGNRPYVDWDGIRKHLVFLKDYDKIEM